MSESLSPTPTLPPLVGRDRELAHLRAALATTREGQACFVHVTGEAGIGKSRLVAEFCAGIDPDTVIVEGRCYQDLIGVPFWPWGAVVEACLARCHGLEEALGPKRRHLGLLTPSIELPSTLASAASDEQRFLLFDAVRALVRAVCRSRPLLLVLEDLHWASLSSVRLLEFVVRELRNESLLVITTTRTGEPMADEAVPVALAALTSGSQALPVELVGLDEHCLGQLVAHRIGRAPEQAYVRAILQQSGGNPFFALALALYRAETAAGGREQGVPSSVSELVLRRVALSSPSCALSLRRASVIGQKFSADLLEQLCAAATDEGDASPAFETLEALDEAVHAGLLVPTGLRSYEFVHAIIRDALYSELGMARQAELHRIVGEAIESGHGGDAHERVAQLAHHFVRAAVGGDVDRAVAWACSAGALALDRLAFEDAARHYGAALEVADMRVAVDRRQRCKVLGGLSAALSWLGEQERSRLYGREAAELARSVGDVEALALAALGHAGLMPVAGATDGATVALLESALEQFAARDHALAVRVRSRLGMELYWSDVNASAMHARSAVEMARRLESPATIALALSQARFSLWRADNLAELEELGRESLALAQRLDDPLLMGHARMWRILDELAAGRIDVAEVELLGYERLVEGRLQVPVHRWRALMVRALLLVIQGRVEEAERLALESFTAGQKSHPDDASPFFFAQQLQFTWLKGQGMEVIEAPVRALAGRLADTLPPWRAALGCLYAELGHADEARVEIEALVADDFAALRNDLSYLPVLCLAAEAAAQIGAADLAALILPRLRPFTGTFVVVGLGIVGLGPVCFFRARAAATAGAHEEAREHFRNTEKLTTEMRARPYRAWGRLREAEFLAQQGMGGGGEVRDLILAAAQEFEALGLAIRAEHARELLVRLGADRIVTEERAALPPECSEAIEGTFLRDGKSWLVGLGDERVRLRHSKGMAALAHLLQNPQQSCLALDVVRRIDPAASPAETVLDDEARADLQDRFRKIDGRIETAAASDDAQGVAELREERARLAEQAVHALGLGDEASHAPSERARINVTRTIKAAIGNIQERAPCLGEHLEATISTGTICRYDPEPCTPVRWMR